MTIYIYIYIFFPENKKNNINILIHNYVED